MGLSLRDGVWNVSPNAGGRSPLGAVSPILEQSCNQSSACRDPAPRFVEQGRPGSWQSSLSSVPCRSCTSEGPDSSLAEIWVAKNIAVMDSGI